MPSVVNFSALFGIGNLAIVVFTFSPVASKISEHRAMKKTGILEEESKRYDNHTFTQLTMQHIDLTSLIHVMIYITIDIRCNNIYEIAY